VAFPQDDGTEDEDADEDGYEDFHIAARLLVVLARQLEKFAH